MRVDIKCEVNEEYIYCWLYENGLLMQETRMDFDPPRTNPEWGIRNLIFDKWLPMLQKEYIGYSSAGENFAGPTVTRDKAKEYLEEYLSQVKPEGEEPKEHFAFDLREITLRLTKLETEVKYLRHSLRGTRTD